MLRIYIQHLTSQVLPTPQNTLELLLLPKKHAKTDNRPINQQPANNTHNHSLHANQITMRQHDRQRNAHHHQETRDESSQFHDGVAGPGIHEVIVAVRFAADPVGQGREDVGCYYEEGEVVLEEGGGEDYEEETYC